MAQPVEVGRADDPAEHEADRIADRVVAALRRSVDSADEQPAAGTADADVLRRDAIGATGAIGAIGAEGGPVDEDVAARIASEKGRGRPLDRAARTHMETAFGGADFGGVRLHDGAEAAGLNRSVGARAFTLGNDIFFRDGVPDIRSAAGAHLMSHELAHTLQQPSGIHRWPWSKKEKKQEAENKQDAKPKQAPNQAAKPPNEPQAPQLPGKDDAVWSPAVSKNPKIQKEHIDEGKYFPKDTKMHVLEDDGSLGNEAKFTADTDLDPDDFSFEEYAPDPAFEVLKVGPKRYVIAKGAAVDHVGYVKDTDPVFATGSDGKIVMPTEKDVKQTEIADCYLEAALASIAKTKPQVIVDMIKDLGDSVTVRLFNVDRTNPKQPKFTPVYVRVEKSRVRRGAKLVYDRGALWVGMIEKAYAAGRFGGSEEDTTEHRDVDTESNFDRLDFGHSSYAFEALLGKPAQVYDFGEDVGRDDGDSKLFPWSPHERNEYRTQSSKLFSSYSGLVSYQILAKDKTKLKTWMKWLDNGGSAKLDALWHEANAEDEIAAGNADAYVREVIRLEDLQKVFKDNGLSDDISALMLTYLAHYFPGKRGTSKYTDRQLTVWRDLRLALRDNKLIVANAKDVVGRVVTGHGLSGGEDESKGLAGKHAYTVLNWKMEGDRRFVLMRNPWGHTSRKYQPQAGGRLKAVQVPKNEDTGETWFELDDLTKRFDNFHIA
jgi:hypothetical protein